MGLKHAQPRQVFGERPELGRVNSLPIAQQISEFSKFNRTILVQKVNKTWRTAVVGRGWQEGHPDTSTQPSRYFFPLTQCEHPNKL